MTLAAHFRAPLPLGVLDLASWVSVFSDYPIIQELPALPTVSWPVPGWPQIPAIEIGISAQLPRLVLRSSDGRFSVQLQGDRFAFGWARVEPIGVAADYPGFEAMLGRWGEVQSRLEAWVQGRFHAKPQYRLAEVNYINASPLELDGQKRRISDVFKFVQAAGRPINMFNVQWLERVYDDEPPGAPLKGVVNAAVGLGQAPPAIPVLAFNFTGTAAVADNQESKHIMNDLHGKIREMYESAMILDAR